MYWGWGIDFWNFKQSDKFDFNFDYSNPKLKIEKLKLSKFNVLKRTALTN